MIGVWSGEARSPAFVRRPRSIIQLRASSVIHLCGAPGSGKSTLAAALSQQLGIPAFGIDDERIRLLRPGESWPSNDALAWCALEDQVNAAGRAIVETSGLHGNDSILFGGRRVFRILCRASVLARTARLQDRVRTGYRLVGDQADYVQRLLRIGEPSLPVNLTVDTSRGLTADELDAVAARARAWLDRGGEGRRNR